MNKQEAIEKLKSKAKPHWLDEEIYGDDCIKSVELNTAIGIVNQIYEPEKPVVPQFVADWLEVCKENLALSLASSMNNIVMSANKQPDETIHWVAHNSETFAKAWLFGYEVEKRKLYTVEIPNPNSGAYLALCKGADGKIFFDIFLNKEWKTFGKSKLTETEIKQDFEWAWQFAEEVEE